MGWSGAKERIAQSKPASFAEEPPPAVAPRLLLLPPRLLLLLLLVVVVVVVVLLLLTARCLRYLWADKGALFHRDAMRNTNRHNRLGTNAQKGNRKSSKRGSKHVPD